MTVRLTTGGFYGETLKAFRSPSFRLSETRYTPRLTLPHHSHQSSYFGFVLKGTYTEECQQKSRTCYPSMIVYHPAGESHAQYFDNTPVHLFRIELDQARLRSLRRTDFDPESPDAGNGLAVGLSQKLYNELCEPDAMSHLAVEGLALELIATLARGKSARSITRQPPRWLAQAHDFIKSHFLKHLTLEEIAMTAGVHPVTVVREFRRHYGCTIGEMVRHERIEFACSELAQSEKSLTEIALSAGFHDQSHFTKTFKRLTDTTPSRYRAIFRQS